MSYVQAGQGSFLNHFVGHKLFAKHVFVIDPLSVISTLIVRLMA